MESFTRRQVLEILRISRHRLRYWETLGLICPSRQGRRRVYSLYDLISMRTILRLTREGLRARRLHHILERTAADEALMTKKPLVDWTLEAWGGGLVRTADGQRVDLGSGQMLFNFQARERLPGVSFLRERTIEGWLALGAEAENHPSRWEEAAQAYQLALERHPRCLEALMNLGTLRFKQGRVEEAGMAYGQALEVAPDHPAVRFNLAAALDEGGRPGEALEHLREAVRLKPDYGDAHFNLALLLDRLGRAVEARGHWVEYLRLDPDSEWSVLARRHLGRTTPVPGPRETFGASPAGASTDARPDSSCGPGPATNVIPLRSRPR